LADDSLMAAASARFAHGDYEESAYLYDTLRKEYPNSEHQLNAHLFAREAKLQVYQGDLYDGAALKDAGEIADQTLIRFPNNPDRQRVVDSRNHIVEMKARRDLAVAQYWDNKHYYGAARMYYKSVVEEFPQTYSAQEARQRLGEIKDLPAEPPNYFGWLDQVLGENKKF
jgi:outer membrane protein assembly factor BamD (BamD/ComL family)